MNKIKPKHRKRLGFTLVELLVVIGILAVLATVSVVGYLSFVKKAKVSNDVSLTTQINTVLASNEAVDRKNVTPYDAITELKEDGGFDINKISPTASGYFFGYDKSDNRMVLFDEDMSVVAPEGKSVSGHERDVFLLVASEDELNEVTKSKSNYSLYLKDNFVESGDNLITVSTGLDVGENKIPQINYIGSKSVKNVLIRTNSASTTLNIKVGSSNNSYDTVNHYGVTGIVNVLDGGKSSYHENGNTSVLEINAGHVVIEETGVVDLVYANPKTATVGEDGKVTKSDTAPTNNISVNNKGDVDHAHSSSDEAKRLNQSNDTNVVFDYNGNTEQNATDDVYHHVSDSETVTGSGTKTDANYNVEDAAKGIVEEALEVERLEDFKENNYWIGCAADSFAGGDGSENNPYQIASAEQLSRLAYLMNGSKYNEVYNKYFKLTTNIDLSSKCWIPIGAFARESNTDRYFCGTFDGDGKTITGLNSVGLSMSYVATMTNSTTPINADGEYIYGLFGGVNNATIKNFTLKDVNIKVSMGSTVDENGKRYLADSVGAAVGYHHEGSLNLESINVSSGTVQGYDDVGGIIGRSNVSSNITLNKCSNGAEVTSVRRAAGLLGYSMAYIDAINVINGENKPKFYDCVNSGAITSLGPTSDFDPESIEKSQRYGAAVIMWKATDTDDYIRNIIKVDEKIVKNTGTCTLIIDADSKDTTVYYYYSYYGAPTI